MEIKLKTQSFLSKYIEQNLQSFILYYKKIYYLISVHHNLPFDSVYYDKIELNVKVNSCWSEVLIMETNNLDLTNLNIIGSFPVVQLNNTYYVQLNTVFSDANTYYFHIVNFLIKLY